MPSPVDFQFLNHMYTNAFCFGHPGQDVLADDGSSERVLDFRFSTVQAFLLSAWAPHRTR